MKPTIFLTGGTGFLGSNLAYRFLKEGHRVYFLVRNDDAVARNRLETAIRVIDSHFRLDRYDCQILRGELTAHRCGLSNQTVANLKGAIDQVWHSAASVNFAYDAAESTREVNVGGTQHVLELATDLGSPDLHHISTSYVAGFTSKPFLETDCDPNSMFKNPYEKTKLEGEQLVHGYGGKFSIYRPSIVVGDSAEGKTLTFSGYYRLFQVFHMLRIQTTWRLRQEPEACRSSGILMKEDGEMVVLPVLLPSSASSTVNLVPIDWVADTMIRLSKSERPSGQTFHITHPQPILARWVIETSCRIMGIAGLRFVEPPVLYVLQNDPSLIVNGDLVRTIQKNLVAWFNVYWPYFCHGPEFDDRGLRKTLNSSYVSPRLVDESFLRVLLGYALANRFKQKGGS